MRKESPKGLHTGSSIQSYRPHTQKQQARKEQLVSVHFINPRTLTHEDRHLISCIQDGDIAINSLKCEFSLNKHRRWEMVKALSDVIDDFSLDFGSGIRITCIERETTVYYPLSFPRAHGYPNLLYSDCIGYHDNHLERLHVIPKGYADSDTLRAIEEPAKNRKQLKKQRRQRKARLSAHLRGGRSEQRQVELKEMSQHHGCSEPVENRKNVPEIRYEIIRPLPFSGHRCFQSSHRERIRETKVHKSCFRIDIPSSRHNKKHKLVKSQLQDDSLYLADADQDILQETLENSHQGQFGQEFQKPMSQTVCLDDAVVVKKPQKRGKKRKKVEIVTEISQKPRKLIHKKDCQQNHEKSPSTEEHSNKNTGALPNDDHHTFDVKVLSESIQPQYMESKYGNRYAESKTAPRIFSISISPHLTVIGKERETEWQMVNTVGDSCFTEVALWFIDTSEDPVTEDKISHCLQQFKDKIVGFEEIVECFMDNTSLRTNTTTVVKPDKLTKIWMACEELRIHSSSTAESLILEEHFRGSLYGWNRVAHTKDPLCGKCSHDEELTCLVECGHWLCDNCWKLCLNKSVEHHNINIKCPFSECEACVDLVALRWYLTPTNFEQMVSDITKHALSQDPHWSQCLKCLRYVQVVGIVPSIMNVECPCGSHWCFFCGQPFHWPATCSQARHYRENLQKLVVLGHGGNNTNHVKMKECPNCKYPLSVNKFNRGYPCHFLCPMCRFNPRWTKLKFRHAEGLCDADIDDSATKKFSHSNVPLTSRENASQQWYERAFGFRKEATKKAQLFSGHLAFQNRVCIIRSMAAQLPRLHPSKILKQFETSPPAPPLLENADLEWLKDFVGKKSFRHRDATLLSHYGCTELADAIRRISFFQRRLLVVLEFLCVMAESAPGSKPSLQLERAIFSLQCLVNGFKEVLSGRAPDDVVPRLSALLTQSASELQELGSIARRPHKS